MNPDQDIYEWVGVNTSDKPGRKIILTDENEAKIWEKSGKGYAFKQLNEKGREIERRAHNPSKYVDAPKQALPTITTSLVHYASGDIVPEELEQVLLPAVTNEAILASRDDFELSSGKDFRIYHRKLVALLQSREREREQLSKPEPVSAFEAHQIKLPCPTGPHPIHYSNIGPAETTCPQCGTKYALRQLFPLLEELFKRCPDLETNSTRPRSRWDFFNAMRGK
jgi:hypothetical protein